MPTNLLIQRVGSRRQGKRRCPTVHTMPGGALEEGGGWGKEKEGLRARERERERERESKKESKKERERERERERQATVCHRDSFHCPHRASSWRYP